MPSRRDIIKTFALAGAGLISGSFKFESLLNEQMSLRKIPSSGEEIPVGIGTWQMFDVVHQPDKSTREKMIKFIES